jgi:elongation factor P--(R)-beta-lysine ligase
MTSHPSASHAALRRRAEILERIRAFFAERGVLEVETPALSPAGVPDLALESIAAHARSLGSSQYLQTSPEYAMKRLLATGIGDIYQLCRVYRDDELGRWHQPEFTLLEWYRVGWDEQRLMQEVDVLLRVLLAPGGAPRSMRTLRVTYADALRRTLGARPADGSTALAARLRERGIDVPQGLSADGVLDLAFSTVVVPELPRDALTFVYDYPASQAALARVKPTNPPVAARFEVFAGGIELANGFHELTDPGEQRRRFAAELEQRRRLGRPAPPLDEEFLAALGEVPACAGVALGVDRLVALAIGADEVAAAMSFAHRR